MHADTPTVTGPARVAQSEADLLNIARSLVGRGGKPVLLLRNFNRIDAIGPTAMGLLQQTLARGVSLQLLRRGGWQRRRFSSGDPIDQAPRRGRLWERHRPLPPLHFSPASVELLAWLHSENVTRPKRALPRRDTTFADEALLYLAADRVAEIGGSLRQPAFLRSPICQLGFADFMLDGAVGSDGRPKRPEQPLPEIDFAPLLTRDAVLLEALQPDLAQRWAAMEARKGNIKDLDEMTRLGAAQQRALANLFAAITGADRRGGPQRRDLAGFLAEAGEAVLVRGPQRLCPDQRWWTRQLDMRASLSARQRAFAAAATFLRGLITLGDWLREAGLVAHFDDDYEAAQLLLSSWRFLHAPQPGPASQPTAQRSVLERAEALARTLESLHSLGAG